VTSRTLSADRVAGTDVRPPVPRRHVVAAHVTAWSVAPAGVWRILLGAGAAMGFERGHLEASQMPGWGTLYVLFLSVLTEALALLSLGLVRPWGEVVPSWIPVLRGRRIATAAVVVPATLGGLALIPLWTYTVVGLFSVEEISGGGWRALMIGCYLPTLLWGPLLLWLSVAYYLRRTR